MDENHRIAKLTTRQRACLRLVYEHKSSKEIARELGVQPATVDEHMRNALQILGVAKRTDAAVMLAKHEHGTASQRLRSQATRVPANPEIAMMALPEQQGRQHGEWMARAVREEQAAFDVGSARTATLRLPFRTTGERRNGLSRMQRLGWVVLMPLLYAVALGMLAFGLHVLATLVVEVLGISTEFQS